MRKILFFIAVLVTAPHLPAQTSANGRIMEGTLASRPIACANGDVYVANDQNPPPSYICGNGNVWGGFGSFSGGTVTSSILPSPTNTINLGSPSQLWLNAYVTNLTIYGSILFNTAAPIIWTGLEGSCTGAASGKDVLCIGDLTTHQVLESDNNGTFNPLAKGTGSFTPGNFVSTSSTNPLLLQDSGINASAVGGPPPGPAPVYDVQNKLYGAIPYSFSIAQESTTATCTGGTASCTLAAAKHFVNNEGIVIYAGGAATTQSTPSAPTLTSPTVTGSTTFHAKCVGLDANGGMTAASASGSVATAPTIFGAPPVVISSISLTSNVVTVNATGINSVSGQYISVSGVTGAGATWNGYWKVVTGGTNSATYNLTSANGTGTVGASSFAQLTNTRGITAISRSTAGVISVTTDGNHNYAAQTGGAPRTIAIINGATPADLNGEYEVLTASTNALTLTSAILPATTETGSVTLGFTTVTVYEEVVVTCPAISAPTVNYAVYGDSPNGGTTVTYLGETLYNQNIFVDWGPFYAGTPQKRGYVPTLPPGAAQAQLYVGTIVTGGGTTAITITPNITTSVSSQGIVHDESQGIQAAINAAHTNGGGVVYLSPIANQFSQYAINYPVSITTSVDLVLGSEIQGNEPFTMQGNNHVFASPYSGSAANQCAPQFPSAAHYQCWQGQAKEYLHESSNANAEEVDGIAFNSSVNGQNYLVIDANNAGYHNIHNISFTGATGVNGTNVGLTVMGGTNPPTSLHLSAIASTLSGPLGAGGQSGTQTGIMAYSPPLLPSVWVRCNDAGTGTIPGLIGLDAANNRNTISYRGILLDVSQCSTATAQNYHFDDDWDQAATTPFVMTYGHGGSLNTLNFEIGRVLVDSVCIAVLGNFSRMGGPTALNEDSSCGGVGLITGNVSPNLTVTGLQAGNVVGQAILGSGGSGTGAGGEAISGFTLSPFCPTTNTNQCFNTPANTQQDVTASWGTGSPTITITDGKFTAADVGKRAFGYVTCNAFDSAAMASNAASGAITTSSAVTITGFTDSNHVTISANPANAVSNSAKGGCFIWGTPDDAGAAAMDTAIQAAPFCAKVLFVAAYYMFTDPHFFTNPTACAQEGTTYNGATANIFYAAGYELEGRGAGATIWYLTPGFPENTTCTHGLSSHACFVRTLEGRWSNFQITGGQNATGGGAGSGVSLIEMIGPGSTDNFTCTNWGAGGNTGLVGWMLNAWEQHYQTNNSGCGYIGMGTFTQINFTGFKVRVENSPINVQLSNSGYFDCYDCGFLGDQFAVVSSGIFQNTLGAAVTLYHNTIQGYGNNSVGYLAATTASSQLIAHDTLINQAAANFTGVKCTVACNNLFEDSNITAAGAGNTYVDVSGSIFRDLGGNFFSGGAGSSISGTVMQQFSSDTAALSTGNIGLTSGWGTSSVASVAPNSTSHRGRFTITGAAGSAGPTLTLTFPSSYQMVAPASCTMLFGNAGAFTDFTQVFAGTPTKTNVVFTFTGTPTAVTIVLDYECGP